MKTSMTSFYGFNPLGVGAESVTRLARRWSIRGYVVSIPSASGRSRSQRRGPMRLGGMGMSFNPLGVGAESVTQLHNRYHGECNCGFQSPRRRGGVGHQGTNSGRSDGGPRQFQSPRRRGGVGPLGVGAESVTLDSMVGHPDCYNIVGPLGVGAESVTLSNRSRSTGMRMCTAVGPLGVGAESVTPQAS